MITNQSNDNGRPSPNARQVRPFLHLPTPTPPPSTKVPIAADADADVETKRRGPKLPAPQLWRDPSGDWHFPTPTPLTTPYRRSLASTMESRPTSGLLAPATFRAVFHNFAVGERRCSAPSERTKKKDHPIKKNRIQLRIP